MSDNAMKTATTVPVTAKAGAPAGQNGSPGRSALLAEIGAKWNKFSEQDLASLKSNDDLTEKVSSKYAQPHNDAKRDVTALLNGRVLN